MNYRSRQIRMDERRYLSMINSSSIPNLNELLLDAPEDEATLSFSTFGCESGTKGEGAFEELGASPSPIGKVIALTKSAGRGFCFVQLQDLSTLNPSFNSSASLEDKPYNKFVIN